MPKGKHKGGRRHFTNFEATEEEKLKKEKEKQWRKTRGEESDEDDEEKSGSGSSEEEESEEETSSEEEDDRPAKAKGVSGLIETQNLNRQVQKTKKVSELSVNVESKPSLTRKEREEVEKQKAAAHYRKLHSQGKTEEARADLERLAIIRKQREDAAKKKEEDRLVKEKAASAKREQVAKALNKKGKS